MGLDSHIIKRKTYFSLVLSVLLLGSTLSARPLNVVASSGTLASLVKEIGGREVQVTSLVSNRQDLHYITPRPSMVTGLKRADLVVRVGMGLDSWLDEMLLVAKNPTILPGQAGYLDASSRVEKLDVPTGRLDASMGDLHIEGNPHYYLDPLNAIVVAQSIRDALTQLRPEKRAYFFAQEALFRDEITIQFDKWYVALRQFSHFKSVSYHLTWRYFARRFDFDVVAQLEPKPGLAPTASHLLYLKKLIAQYPRVAVIQADFHPTKPAMSVIEGTSVPLIILPTEVGPDAGPRYIDLINEIVRRIRAKTT